MASMREPNKLEPRGTAPARIRDFVDRYTTWMKEVAGAACPDAAVAASLADLMKDRFAADLDQFLEVELRLRAFERRVPDQVPLKRVGNDG